MATPTAAKMIAAANPELYASVKAEAVRELPSSVIATVETTATPSAAPI